MTSVEALKYLVDAIHHEKARQALIEILKRPGYFDEGWPAALLVGGYTHLPEIVPTLIEVYKKVEKLEDKVALLKAIGRNGGPTAEKFLCEVLTESKKSEADKSKNRRTRRRR